MKKIIINVFLAALCIAFWYLSLYLGIFADFLFLGIGASASSQKPVFPLLLPIAHMVILTILFMRKKVIKDITLFVGCLSLCLILLYVHVLSTI